jgi:hypothetical protein
MSTFLFDATLPLSSTFNYDATGIYLQPGVSAYYPLLTILLNFIPPQDSNGNTLTWGK